MTHAVEYRDPNAYYLPYSTEMRCYVCGSFVWTGDDGWVCDHDSAMFEYANPALAEVDS